MTFSSEAALKAAILGACRDAVAEVADRVHEELYYALNQYYGEFTPAEYIRTGALMGSLKNTGVISSGNGARARVYFETPGYATGRIAVKSTPITGYMGWASWGGEQVLNTAMGGSHGGYAPGTPIWDSAMGNLGGEGNIENLLLAALKARLPIG